MSANKKAEITGHQIGAWPHARTYNAISPARPSASSASSARNRLVQQSPRSNQLSRVQRALERAPLASALANRAGLNQGQPAQVSKVFQFSIARTIWRARAGFVEPGAYLGSKLDDIESGPSWRCA